MKPTTLEEALSMVPTHWMLTPGVDVWQDGDEVAVYVTMTGVSSNHRVSSDNWGDRVKHEHSAARRPIPQYTRRRTAEIVLAGAKIKAAGVDAAWQHFTHNFPLESWILAGKP